jgi:phytoene desaturase
LSENYELKYPITVGNQKYAWMFVKNFAFDKTLAPPGNTVVESTFAVEDFQYWEALAKDKKAYSTEKQRRTAVVADELDRKYPGFKNAIEVTDVATPMTYIHYTGN